MLPTEFGSLMLGKRLAPKQIPKHLLLLASSSLALLLQSFGWGRRFLDSLLLALGGIQEDVLHIKNLTAEVFAPHCLLFLELAEHQPLLPQCLNHSSAVAVQPLLVKQELSWKRVRRAAALWDPFVSWKSAQPLPLPCQLQS
jgi:hypothetical protein